MDTKIMTIKIGHIELFVANPKRSLPFYLDGLGGTLVANQNDTFIWIRLGDVELLLRPTKTSHRANEYAQSKAGLVLYTDDVETAVDHLKGYGVCLHQKEEEPECFFFQDPDGHWFQLVNPNSH